VNLRLMAGQSGEKRPKKGWRGNNGGSSSPVTCLVEGLPMFKFIGVAVAVALAIVCILAVTKPDNFRVQRVIIIKAPPEKVFALINDFHAWGAWSPWEKLDPDMKRSFSGTPSGKGAVYAWEGNSKVGLGRMEIREAQAPASINIQLDFTLVQNRL
jgi:hypothetical protein